jgi:hypothetical protein
MNAHTFISRRGDRSKAGPADVTMPAPVKASGVWSKFGMLRRKRQEIKALHVI